VPTPEKKKKRIFSMLFYTGIVIFIVVLMQPISIIHFNEQIAMLFPKGTIALEERNLLFILQALMLIVIIPVYILTFIFSWRYRADNTKATYDPDLVDNHLAEVLWWGIPFVMTLIVAALTWVKTHELDPFKPIESNKKAMTIQVVALQWKWLFIYPEEKIATVNFLQFPKDTPIHFEITADAPMNSFWIPRLGGQIYAMPNMKTELHLIANDVGDFRGSSANLSGEGFSGMTFVTRASLEEDYHKWIETVKKSSKSLNFKEYEKLAAPSENNPVELYQLKDLDLFNQIINKYMHPQIKE
jgi:cytochrome o ubiquinol oxidase subunit II